MLKNSTTFLKTLIQQILQLLLQLFFVFYQQLFQVEPAVHSVILTKVCAVHLTILQFKVIPVLNVDSNYEKPSLYQLPNSK